MLRTASRQLTVHTALRSTARGQIQSQAARTIFTIVQQGHEGWRLSFGRDPVKLEPGLHLFIPYYHTVHNIDMRETSVTIKDLAGFTSDNVPVSVSGSLFFRVRDSYHACFSVGNFAQNVTNIGTSAIRSIIGHFTYDEVIGDRNAINQKLHDVIGQSINKWGVECTRFEIQNFHPSNRDVEKQLELQMQAERERRKQILDTQALVNVAEGHKQRTILESEGALQAMKNNAEGHKQRVVLESEGHLTAAKNEGEALARQVDIIARSLAEPNREPNPEQRAQALDALVELRRLEQLKAIASGHGNSTYFFGDAKGTGRDSYDVENMEKWKRSLNGNQRTIAASTALGTS